MRKNITKTLLIISLVLFISNSALAGDTYSGQAVRHSGKAVSHASEGIGNAIVGSGQVTSAVIAVPLIMGSAVGTVSGVAGSTLMDAAASPATCKPLKISDETVTAGPAPDKVLKSVQGE